MKFSNEIKLTLMGIVFMLAVMPFDLQILQYVDAHNDCRPFYDAITDIGLGKWWTIPSGILFLLGAVLYAIKKLPPKFIPAWRVVAHFFAAVALAGIIVNILKRLFARARPVEYLQHQVTGFFHWHDAMAGTSVGHFASFPSGHSTTMFAVGTAIAYLLPPKLYWIRIPVFVCVLILLVSRVMVEAHYASDVVAGAIIGAWGAILARAALQKWGAKYNLAV